MPELFNQLTFKDGDLPTSHIAEVLAVSYFTKKMRIKLLTSFPQIELPAHPVPPEPEVPVTVECYYRPSVPVSDGKVKCQIVSARYFMVGEKVFAISTGKKFYVIGPILPCYISSTMDDLLDHTRAISASHANGGDVEREDWADIISFVSSDNKDPEHVLLPDGSVAEFHLGWAEHTSNNDMTIYVPSRKPDQSIINRRYPIDVLIPPSTGFINGWKYIDSHPLGIKENKISFDFVSYYKNRVYSALFPTAEPSVRLDVMQTEDDDAEFGAEDRLPDVVFFAAPADTASLSSGARKDFAHVDDHYKEIFRIERPWGSYYPNTTDQQCSNWTPNVLFSREIIGDYETKVFFGFVDYKKCDDPPQGVPRWNEAKLVTGSVTATNSQGKEMPGVSDFSFDFNYSIESFDSKYKMRVEHVCDPEGEPPEPTGDPKRSTQTKILTATMNYSGNDTYQKFKCFSDGKNSFYIKPIVFYEKKWISVRDEYGNQVEGTYEREYITVETEYYVNDTKICTGKFKNSTEQDDELRNQEMVFFKFIDIEKKQFIVDVYILDIDNEVKKVKCIIIEGSSKYTIWEYIVPYEEEIHTIYNLPPWLDDDRDILVFKDYNSVSTYNGTTWNSPFFDMNGLYLLQPQWYYRSQTGVYYPYRSNDEDIKSIPFLKYVNVDFFGEYKIDRESFNFIKNDGLGWLAFADCPADPAYGTISYPFGSKYIKKRNGVVSSAEELDGPPDEIWNTYQ